MSLFPDLAGMVRLELTSANLESAYDALLEKGIRLFSVHHEDELTAVFTILRKDYQQVKEIVRKRGEKLTLRKRQGLYWQLKRLKDRPVLLTGAALLLLFTLLLPTKVLFIRVEGNSLVPSRRILSAASQNGIFFGASREEVRSEAVKNSLLSALPELKWAGVNTYGCLAVITVEEKERVSEEPENGIGHIIAERDGIIQEITVSRGTALCAAGQAVSKGQILISGYTDCNLAILAARAQGEVYAYTNRELRAVSPLAAIRREESSEKKYRVDLLLGKNRINLWKGSGICPPSCDRMYKEYYLTLPGGFSLPAGIALEEIICYSTGDIISGQCETALPEFALGYIQRQMTAGVILQNEQVLCQQDSVWYFEGTYLCREMIGRELAEQIGDYHGESN